MSQSIFHPAEESTARNPRSALFFAAPVASWIFALVAGLMLNSFSSSGGAAMLLLFLAGNVLAGAAFVRLIGGARSLFFALYLLVASAIGIVFLIFAAAAVTGTPLS